MDSSTELVKVRLDDGSEIKFEAASPGGERDVVDYERVINADSVAKTIESTVRMLQGTLERLKPDKASVKFGVKIAVESGQLTALVVKGSGEGNLEVTFEWGK